ncbi:protein ACCELERATED CELL DEATH 6-like [Actinidia eriantha]|uniref:protein ACCELERATED CELL DEATH 6-like n=1 Tax=Actinidia eriantha TaxID=165200 RepID=UPI0025843334|nr:protein ACCELERATED CELL DEATH 6-like [Actinidia eriantha]
MDPRLYHSAKSGDIFLLKQLFNENPSLVLNVTPHENTPLHIAACFGNKSSVSEIYNQQRSLLARPNLDGDTPLHVAARAGHFSIVRFMVGEILSWSSIDIESRRNRGIEMLRMRNKGNDTVLHEAVRNHHLKVAEFLIKVDPELACSDDYTGESPLYLAARDGMVELVHRMLMASPSSSHSGSDGQTALHAAVLEGHFDVMEALLKAKPRLVKETDHHGRTPLYYAASSGDHKTVQRLLQFDTATAYLLDKDGQSPLHAATCQGHMNVIKVIIYCCPDSGELLDVKGQNALHVAILGGKVKVVRYVLETPELARLINQVDNEGNTPLHLATMERKTWIVRYLLWDGRADPRAKNNIGQTAINIDPSTSKDKDANGKMQTYKEMAHTLLMVATLITTVTFAAAFTMPGGFNNDVGPNQGLALLRSRKYLKMFIISDSIAMSSSMAAACIIFWGAVIAKETYLYYFFSATVLTYIALQSTAMAFTTGLLAVMPHQPFIYILCNIVGSFFHISTCLFLFQFAQIFSLCEAFQFVVYCIFKLNSRLIKR